MAGAVNSNHMHAVGNGMTALHGLPGLELLRIYLFSLGSSPADGSRIKQDFCTHKAGNAGSFGIPLIPADQHSDPGITGFKNLVTRVTGEK